LIGVALVGLLALAFLFPLSPFFVRGAPASVPLGPWLTLLSEGKGLLRVEGPERPLGIVPGSGGAWTLGQARKTDLGTEYEVGFSKGSCETLRLLYGVSQLEVSAPALCSEPKRLVFLADYQNGPRFSPEKLTRVLAFEPELFLFGGDAAQFPADRRLWQDFASSLGPLLARVPLLAAAGNHDFMNFQPRSKEFCNWYLGGACQGPRGYQRGPLTVLLLPWGLPLEEAVSQVEALEGKLKILVLHHPPLSEGFHGSAYDQRLAPLLAGKVDLVLSGHNHGYEHLFLGGVHFVTASSLGASRYDQGPGEAQGLQKADCCADGVFLELEEGRLRVRAQNLESGAQVDDFTLQY
jgi:hypothetical protein